jgi:hypothetical protein
MAARFKFRGANPTLRKDWHISDWRLYLSRLVGCERFNKGSQARLGVDRSLPVAG